MPKNNNTDHKKLTLGVGYQTLVKQVRFELEGLESFLREKTAHSYWRVGRFIDWHLLKNRQRAQRNKFLIANLAEDVGRDFSVLYCALRFYRAYPKLVAQPNLDWDHYKKLTTIKDRGERKRIQDLVIQENWDTRKLQEYLNFKRAKGAKKKSVAALAFTRGRLAAYRVAEKEGSPGELLLDLGFRVRQDFPEAKKLGLKSEDCVSVGTNSFIKADANKEEIFTYRAKIEKIIDGDTLWALIDLAPGLFIQQKFRLRGIDCPEIDTPEGKKAKRFVESKLKDCEFIIIKTYKDRSDKFDRYLADIFYSAGQTHPNLVAEQGGFLNQELLSAGLAVVF